MFKEKTWTLGTGYTEYQTSNNVQYRPPGVVYEKFLAPAKSSISNVHIAHENHKGRNHFTTTSKSDFQDYGRVEKTKPLHSVNELRSHTYKMGDGNTRNFRVTSKEHFPSPKNMDFNDRTKVVKNPHPKPPPERYNIVDGGKPYPVYKYEMPIEGENFGSKKSFHSLEAMRAKDPSNMQYDLINHRHNTKYATRARQEYKKEAPPLNSLLAVRPPTENEHAFQRENTLRGQTIQAEFSKTNAQYLQKKGLTS